ncbi:TPA: oligosaccharide flippase family protein [Streptococcus pneumoniae]
MKRKSIARNYLLNLIKMTLSILFPLISYPYVSRILSVDGLGAINFSASFVNYFVLIAIFGINVYAVREGAKYRDDKKLLGKFVTEMLLVSICTAMISFSLLTVSLLLPALSEYRSLILIFSITIIFNVVGMEWFFQLMEDYQYITLRAIIFQILSLIFLFIFVKDRNDIYVYALITVAANAGSQILNLFRLRKEVEIFRYKDYNIRNYFKPMFLIFLTLLSMNIYRYLDVTFLGFFKNDRSVGYYSLATKITSAIISMVSSVTVILTPRLAYHYKKEEFDKFYKIAYSSFDFILLLAIPVVIGVLSFSSILVDFLGGSTFVSSVLTVEILSLTILFSNLNALLITPILTVMNREKAVLKIFIIALIFNVITNMLLIPVMDFNGSALVTVLTEGIICILSLISIKSVFNVRRLFKNLFQYLVASIFIIVVKIVISQYVSSNYIIFISTALLSAILYFLTLILLRNELVPQLIIEVRKKIYR